MCLYFCFKIKMANARRLTIIELDSLNLPEIGRRFKNNNNECIRWCREFDLLAINLICPCDVISSATNKIVIMSMARFGDACKNNAKRK